MYPCCTGTVVVNVIVEVPVERLASVRTCSREPLHDVGAVFTVPLVVRTQLAPMGMVGQLTGDAAIAGAAVAAMTVGAVHAAPRASVRRLISGVWSLLSMSGKLPRGRVAAHKADKGVNWFIPTEHAADCMTGQGAPR